jgi:hypothetical protein
MTFEEFLEFRDVKLKNEAHKRIAELFFQYFYSVTGDRRLLPDLIGKLIGMDLSHTVTRTACLNGIFDGSVAPYENVDLYIRFENEVRIFIYGTMPTTEVVQLRENEFVLFILADSLFGRINQTDGRYTYILK